MRFLGDDLDERAAFIDDLLKRCSQEGLDQIMAALAQATQRRLARGETVGEDVRRRGRRDQLTDHIREPRNELRDRRERRELEVRGRRERRPAEVRDLREERRRRRRVA